MLLKYLKNWKFKVRLKIYICKQMPNKIRS
jgi:hypothetical protein